MKKLCFVLILVSVVGFVCVMADTPTSAAEPKRKVQIPRIDKGPRHGEGDWSTWIQVQNVGDQGTGAVAFFWGAYSGLCPSNDPGPMGHACMSIPANGVWTLRSQIPADAYSAIIYSVDDSDFQDACDDADLTTTADWNVWKEDYEDTGQPLESLQLSPVQGGRSVACRVSGRLHATLVGVRRGWGAGPIIYGRGHGVWCRCLKRCCEM